MYLLGTFVEMVGEMDFGDDQYSAYWFDPSSITEVESGREWSMEELDWLCNDGSLIDSITEAAAETLYVPSNFDYFDYDYERDWDPVKNRPRVVDGGVERP